jgi:hypothetical protein
VALNLQVIPRCRYGLPRPKLHHHQVLQHNSMYLSYTLVTKSLFLCFLLYFND